jgi:N-methylhydantoinase B
VPPYGAKIASATLRAGERIRLETPGGGGFGLPADRQPDRIKRDLRLGYISREAAARDYGIEP